MSYLPSRLLPHSSEGERALISSILRAPAASMARCAESAITRHHFYVPSHGVIYDILSEFISENEPIDFIILTQVLSDRNQLENIGGPAFVTELFAFVPTAANIGEYIEIVKQKATLRSVIAELTPIVAQAYDDTDDVDSLIERVERSTIEIVKFAEGKAAIKAPTMKDNYFAVMDRLEAVSAGTIPSGLKTGLHDLDWKLGGMHNGEVIVVSGVTGGGKTSLAHNIIDHVSIVLRKPTLIWSYEMKRLWVTSRLIAARGKIDTENIRRGELTPSEEMSFARIGQAIVDAPITIEDNADTTLDELRRQSRKWKADTDGALIVVDYLQKIPHSRKNKDSRQREVAEISDGLQKMAMELDIPILALCQINKDGRMREAEDIGFDAKTVLKICRREQDEEVPIEKEPIHCGRDIVIVKNNNGGLGYVHVCFLKNYVKFVDITRPDEQPELAPPKKSRK